METFLCLGDIIVVRDGASDSNVTIRGEWCKFRDQMPLIDSRVLSFGAKGKLYSALCIYRYTISKWDLASSRERCDQTMLSEWFKNG